MHSLTFSQARITVILALLLSSAGYAEASARSPFNGTWQINYEETDKVAVKYKDGSGMKGHNFGRPQVTVMGLPLPGTGRRAATPGLAGKDPKVLRCGTMVIAVDDKSVVLNYDGDEVENMRRGDYRGRKTKVSSKLISQKYKSTSRTVTKSWSIRPDGRLLVSVKLNPKKDKARTYKRVFDRVE